MKQIYELVYPSEDINLVKNILEEIQNVDCLISENAMVLQNKYFVLKEALYKLNFYQENIFSMANSVNDKVEINLNDFIIVRNANNLALKLCDMLYGEK